MNFGINKGISAIDSAAIKEVAGQIFSNATKKDVQTFNIDYSKFNRASLGVDLYGSNLDINQVQQIAVRNAGLDLNFQQNQAIVASVQYLNRIAALGTYAMPSNMDGKIHIPQESTRQDLKSREVFQLPASSITSEVQDLLGGETQNNNPFKFITINSVDSNEQEQDSQNTSIFKLV